MEELNSAVWHPYTPGIGGRELWIEKAKGAYLYTREGRKILDGISSWWVNTHGHAHPYIAKAIARQARKLEQVVFAGFTHSPAEDLARRLLPFLPGKMSRVFFSDNGSTSVEVAIKMALQYFHIQGIPARKIVALRNSYHGDTFGAMALGERGPFSAAFSDHLFEVEFIDPPYTHKGPGEPVTEEEALQKAFHVLSQSGVAALVVEPLVQGAGGMLMYPARWLEKVFEFAQSNGILCICDEVFTGFFRTGTAFASGQLTHTPDILCLSKGLTAGFLPMGLTVATEKVAAPFQKDSYTHTFYHGHSFTANPLACAAALANLDLIEENGFPEKVELISELQRLFVREVSESHPEVEARATGTIFALTLNSGDGYDYTHPIRQKIYPHFLKRNLLLRPIGNVLYTVPPYCIESSELEWIHSEILGFLQEAD